MKKGISLIVLIITIIVMLILTGAVILSFIDNNPINEATRATFRSNMNSYQNAVLMYVVDQIDVGDDSKVTTLADINVAAADMGAKVNERLAEVYPNNFEIIEGVFTYVSGLTADEETWLDDLGIPTKP